MKKIIAAFDGFQIAESTMDYALDLAKQTGSHLVGVFLDDPVYHSYGYKEIVSYHSTDLDRAVDQWNENDRGKRNEAADQFEDVCQKAGINFSIHRDKNVAIQELLHESIYADLLIISWNEKFVHGYDGLPSTFIRDLLTDVQCPVFLVPETYRPIKKLVLLYDGEPNSVHAVKMFSYLLPELKHLDAEVVSIKSSDESLNLPDKRLMMDFMKRHFPKAGYQVFRGQAEDQIVSFLHQKKYNALIILGAYRRSRVSRWFRPSMADHLMKNIGMPLFIAHNK
jgi:nucleotide-binding universal stress UspA family protein